MIEVMNESKFSSFYPKGLIQEHEITPDSEMCVNDFVRHRNGTTKRIISKIENGLYTLDDGSKTANHHGEVSRKRLEENFIEVRFLNKHVKFETEEINNIYNLLPKYNDRGTDGHHYVLSVDNELFMVDFFKTKNNYKDYTGDVYLRPMKPTYKCDAVLVCEAELKAEFKHVTNIEFIKNSDKYKKTTNDPKNIKIITHFDLDGAGCAIAGKLYFPDSFVSITPVTYHNVNTKVLEALNDEKWDKIFITDISVSKETAEVINNQNNNGRVVLIDHHPDLDWLRDGYDWTHIVSLAKGELPNKDTESGSSLFYKYLKNKYGVTYYDIALGELVDVVRKYDTYIWKKY